MSGTSRNYLRIIKLFISRGISLGLQLLLQIVIARFLGPSATGALQLFITATSVSGELSSVGIPSNNMRQCAKVDETYSSKSVIAHLANTLKKPLFISAIIAVSVFLAEYLALFELPFPSWVFFISIASYTAMRCLSEALKAFDYAKFAVFTETATIPLLLLIVIGPLITLNTGVSDASLIVMYSFGFTIATLIILIKLSKVIHKRCSSNGINFEINAYDQWLPVWSAGILAFIYGQFCLLVLPFYTSVEELGIISVAIRYIGLSTTLLLILSSWFSPRFSRASDDPAKLCKLLYQTQGLSLAFFTPFALAFLTLPETLLGIFGPEFVEAKLVLQILCIAQLVNSATGLPGVMLIMIGKAHIEKNILLSCLAVSTLMVLIVGEIFGALGVVYVFAVLTAVKNILSYLWVQRYLKLA